MYLYNFYAVKSPSISHTAAFMAIDMRASCVDVIEAYKAKLTLLAPTIDYTNAVFDLYPINELPSDIEPLFLKEVIDSHPLFWILDLPYYDTKVGYLFSLTNFENWLGLHSVYEAATKGE